MTGIDLNQPIIYKHSSMRFFKEGEYHITRYCKTDVLLLVFDGVLSFCEDGVEYELKKGDYHIQKAGSYQTASLPSQSPKYLYVHFIASWNEGEGCLSKKGIFDYPSLKGLMEKLDMSSGEELTLTEINAFFYQILSSLYRMTEKTTTADMIARYLTENMQKGVCLEELAKRFHFSKNHIINIFKKRFGVTPFEYMNNQRIKKAKQLMTVTSLSAESIAYECGFGDYSHFYKLFKKNHGICPDKWRRSEIEMLNNAKELY